jgi:hypothetical protein
MKKPNPLMAGLAQFDRKANPAPDPVAPPPAAVASKITSARPPSRQGAVQIAAFFPEDVRAQLKVVAAEQRRDVQDLMAEALNLIFVKYGKPEIAPVKSKHAN